MNSNSTKIRQFLESAFAVFTLQIAAGGILTLFRKASLQNAGFTTALTAKADGNPLTQKIWFLIYLITFCLMALRWRQALEALKRDRLLLALLGLAIASALWSTAPSITLRRSIGLAGSAAFGIYLTSRFSSREILRLVIWTLGIGTVLSFVYAIAIPDFGIMTGVHAGAWRGIYGHKNALGRLMVINVGSLLLFKPRTYYGRFVKWTLIALATALILLSTSKTALVCLCLLPIFISLYQILQWRSKLAIPAAIGIILVNGTLATLILANLETIVVEKLGRNLTFSGRAYLWEAAVHTIGNKPFLGHGYGGFWLGFKGPSAELIKLIDWEGAPNSHNGFLDLGLQLGLIGLGLFLVVTILNFYQAAVRISKTKSKEELWPLLMLTLLVIYNCMESSLPQRNGFFWVLYVIVVFARPAVYLYQAKTSSLSSSSSTSTQTELINYSPQ